MSHSMTVIFGNSYTTMYIKFMQVYKMYPKFKRGIHLLNLSWAYPINLHIWMYTYSLPCVSKITNTDIWSNIP